MMLFNYTNQSQRATLQKMRVLDRLQQLQLLQKRVLYHLVSQFSRSSGSFLHVLFIVDRSRDSKGEEYKGGLR